MEIVLLKTIKTLGRSGEVKEVKKGYALNFLIPYGWALPATKGFVKEAQNRTKKIIKETAGLDVEALKTIFAAISGVKLTIIAKAKNGKLFGSIKKSDIAEAIADKTRENIDEKLIVLEEPIKKTGDYEITLAMQDLSAHVLLTVKEEESVKKPVKKVLKKTPMKKTQAKAKKSKK
ncbi:50S ribosomal protein L9 [Candidatus Microgenomates bacterium]|nr:50S ribosomal protein L9 [Candidatus Microgenomates bacterium]